MKQPRSVCAEFLPGQRDDAPQDLSQFQRAGERFQDRSHGAIPLLVAESRRAVSRIEMPDDQRTERRAVRAVSLRQLENASHRLLALCRVTQALPA